MVRTYKAEFKGQEEIFCTKGLSKVDSDELARQYTTMFINPLATVSEITEVANAEQRRA